MTQDPLKNFQKFSDVDEEESEVRDLVKLVFLGDSGVGKTNIMTRFSSDNFNMICKPTIGVDFSVKTVRTGNHVVRLQLWDTAGQERYRSFTSAYFKDAHGVLLVYDITSRASFTGVHEWLKSCIDNTNRHKTSLILVGNKTDLREQREVSEEEGRDFAIANDMLFMETTAFDHADDGIDKAFYMLVNDIIPKYDFPQASDVPQVQKKKASALMLSNSEAEFEVGEGAPRKKGCCV